MIPTCFFILVLTGFAGLTVIYGFWSLWSLLFSTAAAWCQSMAVWCNLMRDARKERQRLFREYLEKACADAGVNW